jgi:hypothetical protein
VYITVICVFHIRLGGSGLGGKKSDNINDNNKIKNCDSGGNDYSDDNDNDDSDSNDDDNDDDNDNDDNNNDNDDKSNDCNNDNNNDNNNNDDENNLSVLVKLSIGVEIYTNLIKSLKNKLKINENENEKISKNPENEKNITITWGEFLLIFIPTGSFIHIYINVCI